MSAAGNPAVAQINLPAKPTRDRWQAIKRGSRLRCPNCGEGLLFRAYLKVNDTCPVCGEEFFHQRADDAALSDHPRCRPYRRRPDAHCRRDRRYPADLDRYDRLAGAHLEPVSGAATAFQGRPDRLSMGAAHARIRYCASGAKAPEPGALTENALASPARTSGGVRPAPAATLILIDRSGKVPKVLMGRRHAGHFFHPNKYVFPGGRLEPQDRRMNVAGALSAIVEEKLMKRVARPSPARARAQALAAIRGDFRRDRLASRLARFWHAADAPRRQLERICRPRGLPNP